MAKGDISRKERHVITWTINISHHLTLLKVAYDQLEVYDILVACETPPWPLEEGLSAATFPVHCGCRGAMLAKHVA